MSLIEPERFAALAERAPADARLILAGALCPVTLATAVSRLWELGSDAPTILLGPLRLVDALGWGDEPPPDLRFDALPPRDWWCRGTLRGRFLDCEVHAHPCVGRDLVVVADPRTSRPDGSPAVATVTIV